MKEYQFYRFDYLLESSLVSDNCGQTPVKARYSKTFVSNVTGQLFTTTDLIIKKRNRDKFFFNFNRMYFPLLRSKKITILSLVVNEEKYGTISKFINSFVKKLKRNGIARLGYVWSRDIGDVKFKKHFHLLFAFTRISPSQFSQLFQSKKHNDYNVEFVKTVKGISNYITKKELYAKNRQRAFGKSRKFEIPVKNSL